MELITRSDTLYVIGGVGGVGGPHVDWTESLTSLNLIETNQILVGTGATSNIAGIGCV